MKHLDSLDAMALELALAGPRIAVALLSGLEQIAVRIEATAYNSVGEYQEASGGFPAWAPLAPATESYKARMGYPGDAPLLATGQMRDSLTHDVDVPTLTATIGFTDPKMVFHEFGTEHVPPRPVMGPALFNNLGALEMLCGAAVAQGLIGQDRIHSALGYDMKTSDAGFRFRPF